MAKINPFTLSRPDETLETRSFRDDSNPGVEFTFTLRLTPDPLRDVQMIARRTELIQDYIAPPEGRPIKPLLPVGNPPQMPTVALTPGVINSLTLLESLQVAEDRYNFEELLALSLTMPSAMSEAITWSTLAYYRGKPGEGDTQENPTDAATDS